MTQEPSLAELLADEAPVVEEKSTETPEGEAGESQSEAKPSNLKALAEKLELEDKDLYDIEVPMANGESLTLGALKDAVAQQSDLDLQALQFEEQKREQESQLRTAQNELRELISALPEGALNKEALEKMRTKHAAEIQAERQRTLEVIPEWKDETTRVKELEGIVEHFRAYGFPDEYLSQIHDHRTLKYIRDNYLREQRIQRALAKVQKTSNTSTKTKASKPQGDARKKVSVPKNSRNALADFLAND